MSLTTCRCSMSSIIWPGRIRASDETRTAGAAVRLFLRDFWRCLVAATFNALRAIYYYFVSYDDDANDIRSDTNLADSQFSKRKRITTRLLLLLLLSQLCVRYTVNRRRRVSVVDAVATPPLQHHDCTVQSRGTATAAASMALAPRAPARPPDASVGARESPSVGRPANGRGRSTARPSPRRRFDFPRRCVVVAALLSRGTGTRAHTRVMMIWTRKRRRRVVVDVATRPPRPPVLSTFESHNAHAYTARPP